MPVNTQDGPGVGFRLDDFLPYKLAVVTDCVSRVFAGQCLDGHNLTIPEWRILVVISEHGTMSPTMVASRTAMDKVKVSRAAQSLVAKGLLRQGPDPRDGRGRLLKLTRKGATTQAAVVPLTAKLEATLYDGLSRNDIAMLNRVLAKITTRLDGIEADGDADGA